MEGNGDVLISSVSKIENGSTGSLSFLANPKYTPFIYKTHASAVIVARDFKPAKPLNCTLIRVNDPYTAFLTLLEKFNHIHDLRRGIESPVYISDGVKIPASCYIGAFVYLGKDVVLGENVKIFPHTFIGDKVTIGDNTLIYSGVRIYHNSVIGKKNILHAGAVIGSDGFGFSPQEDGSYKKIIQTGNVVIEDDVEIGANTCIDRATLGSTIIRSGVKLDNLIHIAHNVEIGKNTAIAAQTGVSGSTHIGERNIIGGQVGIVGHLTLADGTQIGAQSGVSKSVTKNNSQLRGSPAQDYKQQLKSEVVFRRLPELYQKIQVLEKKIANFEAKKKPLSRHRTKKK